MTKQEREEREQARDEVFRGWFEEMRPLITANGREPIGCIFPPYSHRAVPIYDIDPMFFRPGQERTWKCTNGEIVRSGGLTLYEHGCVGWRWVHLLAGIEDAITPSGRKPIGWLISDHVEARPVLLYDSDLARFELINPSDLDYVNLCDSSEMAMAPQFRRLQPLPEIQACEPERIGA